MYNSKGFPENNIDLPTPFRMQLSMFFKNSFAYETVKKRWPLIFEKIIYNIEKDTTSIVKIFGEKSRQDIATIKEQIKQMIFEIENNHELSPIKSSKSDMEIWTKKLNAQNEKDGHTTYFNTTFLFCECYLYRRLNAIIENTNVLTNYDPFRNQKEAEFFGSVESIVEIANYIYSITHSKLNARTVKENFIKLLKLALWSNKCDLSLTLGHAYNEVIEPFKLIDKYDENIIVNDSESVWKTVVCPRLHNNTVAIVLDNGGYELFLDYCLADFMISYDLASKVTFYPKAIPWYISDVTKYDADWLIKTMINEDNNDLQKLGERWQNYFVDGLWEIIMDNFWTTSLSYCEMKLYNLKLYDTLTLCKLLIFKGDVNYRKLIDDINWYPTVSFHDALQGFYPTNLCSLRTIKCDCVAGITKEIYKRLENENSKWNLIGDYALIQYDGNF